MILLRLISWPYARKHLLRTVLTMAGIVLGVAVFVGMHTANQSVLAAFHQTIDRIAGSTQIQISSGEVGFEEDVLDKVRELPEVRAAAPVIEASANTGAGNLLILGVDTFLDMGRSATNAVGNSIATAVVAKWEGELLPQAEAEANERQLDREASASLAHPAHG